MKRLLAGLSFIAGAVISCGITRYMTAEITREDADRFWGIRRPPETECADDEVRTFEWPDIPEV